MERRGEERRWVKAFIKNLEEGGWIFRFGRDGFMCFFSKIL